MKINKAVDKSLAVFLAVGLLNTLVSAVVMLALEDLGYWLSTAVAYIIGGGVSFFLNRHITFKSRENAAKSAFKFVINAVICYILAYSIAKPAVKMILANASMSDMWQERAAKLFGMVFYTALNYLGQKNFAFKKR